MGKTPSSHIIHSLVGEYCGIVRDSEPIGLLKSPRSLSVKYPKMRYWTMQTLRIVITLSHLRALHDALRETFLKVTNI